MTSSRPADPSELSIALAQSMRRLRSRLRLESEPAQMRWSWSQLMIVLRLVEDGPATGAELAHAEHVRPQSMHQTLAALRDGGLIATTPHPEDRRKLLVDATPEGRRLSREIPARREAWLEAAIRLHTSSAERRALAVASEVMLRLADLQTGTDEAHSNV